MNLESPTDPRVQAEVDPSFLASRVSLRPLDYASHDGKILGGHYSRTVTTGLVTGVAAAGGLFSLRWMDAQRLFVLQRIIVEATIGVAFGTAQETSVDLAKLVNFTVADSGGTALVPFGSSFRKSPLMGASQVQDMRAATTGALTGGTATVDGAQRSAVLPLGNALGASAWRTLYDIAHAEHPLALAATEGFRIRNLFAQGATGEVRFNFTIDWAEVPVY